VKSIVRSLLLCFLMLALPFQAFAAASMLPRVAQAAAATHGAPLAELPPCHRQMAQEHKASALKAVPSHDAHTSQHGSEHNKGKCGTCAACCIGAAMASSLPAALALAPPSTDSIPFRAGHLPSVDPVLPERPPSTFLA
jgi:hypothetical protein